MSRQPRVALFADTFHEVNGAARTCREFEAFARRRNLPFLSIHAGPAGSFHQPGDASVLALVRSRLSIALDADLRFDPLFFRMRRTIRARLREFQPDLVHLTSFGDFGILGAIWPPGRSDFRWRSPGTPTSTSSRRDGFIAC